MAAEARRVPGCPRGALAPFGRSPDNAGVIGPSALWRAGTRAWAGGIAASRRYDSFGNLELGATNGYAFTSREWDGEADLYYYRARYYDAKAGRFIGEDPIRWAGGLNLFAYVDDRPTAYVDPLGLESGNLNYL